MNLRYGGCFTDVWIRVLKCMSKWVDKGSNDRRRCDGGHGPDRKSPDQGISVITVLYVEKLSF